MGEILTFVMTYTAGAAEIAAAVVVAVGVVQALWIYIFKNVCTKCHLHQHVRGRLKLGHALSLALELLIGADILKSALDPSWTELGQLGAIVLIRTVLNYFLLWDMRKVSEEEEKRGRG
ncbi:MAG: DUF1622 domain-containing protein [Candidatus Aegiribacteria sp.]|nr:DUF1622 domain-containing protein [Candidatus Aegiribacteria sp.]MBD3293936.1 DUF1622 domain-containing protein [Candidatus Fermentibacteria bacterium]